MGAEDIKWSDDFNSRNAALVSKREQRITFLAKEKLKQEKKKAEAEERFRVEHGIWTTKHIEARGKEMAIERERTTQRTGKRRVDEVRRDNERRRRERSDRLRQQEQRKRKRLMEKKELQQRREKEKKDRHRRVKAMIGQRSELRLMNRLVLYRARIQSLACVFSNVMSIQRTDTIRLVLPILLDGTDYSKVGAAAKGHAPSRSWRPRRLCVVCRLYG